MTIKVKILILVAISVVAALFVSGYILGRKKGDNTSQTTIAVLKDEISRYSITMGDLTLQVAEKEQVILTQREAIRKGNITREEMRKLDMKRVAEITRLNMRIDTLLQISSDTEVVFIDTCSGIPKPALLLPYTWSKKDEWLTLKDSCDIKGVNHVSLSMDVPLSLFGAVDKETKKYKVVATTPNRYVKFTEINSDKLDVQRDKKWGIGVIGGYGTSLSAPKLVPFIGIGVSRNLIRF